MARSGGRCVIRFQVVNYVGGWVHFTGLAAEGGVHYETITLAYVGLMSMY